VFRRHGYAAGICLIGIDRHSLNFLALPISLMDSEQSYGQSTRATGLSANPLLASHCRVGAGIHACTARLASHGLVRIYLEKSVAAGGLEAKFTHA
jgi:hypothetical protein